MALAIKFLTETPHALAQLKKEQDMIRSRKGKSEALEWNDYKSMPFTQCVIDETLRVASTNSGVFRQAMTDVNVKGYTIPKGWKVFVSLRAVHMNEDHFKDARTFNPWRWQADSGTNSMSLFNPFGGGPRRCPGAELARVELSIFLHHFVTQYRHVVLDSCRRRSVGVLSNNKDAKAVSHYRAAPGNLERLKPRKSVELWMGA
ncbi:hypothetical protein Vadar_008598 [Vaccinium darrowii]|uniref:Uncharacterized protein n=1 Tax=Vaccinium darrowii TaxID=229202 RepID=A0ACB7XZ73_9ERIC|nr:hypothetical protein Vadar_008598 [Vaccinium darrowii]